MSKLNQTSTLRKTLFVVAILCVFLVFQVRTTLASNNYTSNISFFQNGDQLFLQFYVDTTYSTMRLGQWNDNAQQTFTLSTYCHAIADYITPEPECVEYSGNYKTCTFVAGNTYTIDTSGLYKDGGSTCYTLANYTAIFGAPTTDHFFQYKSYIPGSDYEQYFFTEYPTLTITYPEDNAEIAGSFYIEGHFTQPDPPIYYVLTGHPAPAGIDVELHALSWYFLNDDYREDPPLSGDYTLWISGLPAGYYDFHLYMLTMLGYYAPVSWTLYNIHVVEDQPFSLPPYQSQEPYTVPPVYDPLDPVIYYAENSGYETSTAIYSTFTDILGPILSSVGGSLTQYSSNFTPSNASSTGNQIGESVVMMRSYLSNLDSFFNGFPISLFLTLYLLALVLVVIVRLVKGLIHIFKPI